MREPTQPAGTIDEFRMRRLGRCSSLSACLERGQQQLTVLEARQHDDRSPVGAFAQLMHHRNAVHARHPYVGYDHIGWRRLDAPERVRCALSPQYDLDA